MFFSRVNFLCWLLFRYPFHPRVTAVARKRPRSFCQKRRWQVTAKHAYTLRMWLCMKWHGAWLYGVHRTRRDGSSFLWHQPCQRCKYTTSVDIQLKRAIKNLFTRVESYASAMSLLESREQRYIRAINNNSNKDVFSEIQNVHKCTELPSGVRTYSRRCKTFTTLPSGAKTLHNTGQRKPKPVRTLWSPIRVCDTVYFTLHLHK